eukprot:1094917-Amphidinium_carterae.1
MESPLQKGQDLVVNVGRPGMTCRTGEVSDQVRVFCQKAAPEQVDGHVRCRTITRALFDKRP